MVGRRRGPLIVANPDSDSDSLSDTGDVYPHTTSPSPAVLSGIEPPAPIFGSVSRSIPSDNVSGSSRSSPAPDTTPPPTPGQQQPPVNLNSDVLGKLPQKDRSHLQQFERESDTYSIARAPHHARKPSNDALQNLMQILHSSPSMSPTSTDHVEPRVIMASADGEYYKKVTITFAHAGEAIRELIFAALQIADEDQAGYEIHQDSEFPPDESLSNEQLYDICTRLCSARPLQFLIKRRPQPHLRALPPPPVIAPPVPADRQQLPPIGTALFPIHFTGKRHSPQSQHETSSSTSDRRYDFPPNHDGLPPDSASNRRNNPLPRPPQQRPSVGIRIVRNPPSGVSLSSRTSTSVSSSSLPFVPPLQIRSGGTTTASYARSPPATRDGSYPREHLRSRDGLSSRDGTSNRENTANLSELRPTHIRRGSDVEQNGQDRSSRKELEKRERDRREKENEQIRSEKTKQWQLTQQLAQMRNYPADSSSPSPVERLSPTATWNKSDIFEAQTRPGTSGSSMGSSSRTVSSDRPSTAQPLRSPHNTSFHSSYRPNTANLISGNRQGSIPNLAPSQSYQPPATATGVPSFGFQPTAGDRRQAVPDWWVNYGRALPSMKSFNDLRQQATNAPPRRRLPTPTSATSPRSMNNFGGLSDPMPSYPSSPHHTPSTPLPYHDLPRNVSSLSSAIRRGEFSNAPSEQSRNTPGGWNSSERPRSPPGTPGLYSQERPDYVPPPPIPDVSRNEFKSFGEAAVQLVTHKLSKDSKDRLNKDSSPIISSPTEPTEPTLRPHEHSYLLPFVGSDTGSESTLVSQKSTKQVPTMTFKLPVPVRGSPPSAQESEECSDGSEEESDDNFFQKPRTSRRISKNLPHITTTTAAATPPKIIASNSKGVPLSPIPASPLTATRTKPLQPLSPNPNRNSLFVKRDSITWAVRPSPEDMYERLEDFFPDHDLDKPVIDMTPSGGSSPIQLEAPPVPPTTATKVRYKKSIRAAAHERAYKGSTAAQQMLRKRSTKLWGSRVEEVTPAQAKAATLGTIESPPSSGINTKPIFKWVKGDLIGKGTYGRVYLAFNATAGEMIAVKQVELPKTISDQNDHRQKQVVEALLSESDTLKDLDHPNIVQYLGIEESADHLSVFLEYVPGGSIGGCIRKHGKFDHDVVRSFTFQVLAGLEYLHLRGVLHRDLKADNILLDPSGVCKISDFGISKRSDDIYDNAAFTAMQGSIFWMAPEVMNNKGQGYNAKIDIWSLGCVVLEMWAGKRPWDQDNMYAVMYKLGAERAAPPVPEGVELDEVEDDFRRKCFAIDPNERPTAAELRKHKFLELKPNWVFTGFN